MDESGNTGPDLLNSDQPVFVQASCDFSTVEASNILESTGLVVSTGEFKFSKLKKSPGGRKAIAKIITKLQGDADRVIVTIYNKRFMVYTKLVDLVAETLAHDDGINLYEDGMALGLSNVHFYCLPTFCGEVIAERVLVSFIALIRERTIEASERFVSAIDEAADNSKDPDYAKNLAPFILGARVLAQHLITIGPDALNPAIPSFVEHCAHWGMRLNERFDVLHDDSKVVEDQRLYLKIMSEEWPEEIKFGYKDHHTIFPLKVDKLDFGKSHEHSGLQLVDIISGAYAHYGRGLCAKVDKMTCGDSSKTLISMD